MATHFELGVVVVLAEEKAVNDVLGWDELSSDECLRSIVKLDVFGRTVEAMIDVQVGLPVWGEWQTLDVDFDVVGPPFSFCFARSWGKQVFRASTVISVSLRFCVGIPQS